MALFQLNADNINRKEHLLSPYVGKSVNKRNFVMKYIKYILAVICSLVILSIFKELIYYIFKQFIHDYTNLALIIFLVIVGCYITYFVLQMGLITIPVKRFKATSVIPSYIIAAWIVFTSVRRFYVVELPNYPNITATAFSTILFAEVIFVIFFLIKLKKFVNINKSISDI